MRWVRVRRRHPSVLAPHRSRRLLTALPRSWSTSSWLRRRLNLRVCGTNHPSVRKCKTWCRPRKLLH